MRILAADPGGTSGWATWNDGVVESGQCDFDSFIEFVDSQAQFVDVFVAEKFTINQQTIRHSQQTTALEVIGFLRGIAHLEGVPFVLQTPADAKKFCQVGSDKNARLVSLGWIRRPLAEWDHANDGLRHLMLYLVKNRIIEPPRPEPRVKCTCETFGNGVISGNDGLLPPAEGCPRHG